MPDFDAIIIGTGQAGPSLAFRLAGAGMKVAVVERHLVGGSPEAGAEVEERQSLPFSTVIGGSILTP